jgi:hypothetical protein
MVLRRRLPLLQITLPKGSAPLSIPSTREETLMRIPFSRRNSTAFPAVMVGIFVSIAFSFFLM